MLFSTLDFVIFLPVVFAVYWWIGSKNRVAQNIFIVAASYYFYSCWDVRFLALIVLSTLIDFTVGLQLAKEENHRKRKWLLLASLLANLGMLGFFKYYNFFIESFVQAFSFLGAEIASNSLQIILPVGISFYTFQTLSYTIDVYKKKITATNDLAAFAAFVSFFPQLVAGPIERAKHFLPQFQQARQFNYHKAVDGLRQMLWGAFKKVVIADNAAEIANQIFNNSDNYSGSALLLEAVFFAFQIYGDFSGYSDIAIGAARLMGFDLKKNFAFPYFSRDFAEFWRRWHISLSTWFRDYIYIPLGGSRGTLQLTIRNVFIVFVISGLWHGANWTFVVWGGLHAIFMLPLLLFGQNRKHVDTVAQGRYFPSWKELLQMVFTFSLTVLAWVFFRAENLTHAFAYLGEIFSWSTFTYPNYGGMRLVLRGAYFITAFCLIEWLGREDEYAIEKLGLQWKKPFRYLFYYAIIFCIFWYQGKEQVFLYFQF